MVKGHNQEEHKKPNVQAGAKTVTPKTQSKRKNNEGRNSGMDESGGTKGQNAIK